MTFSKGFSDGRAIGMGYFAVSFSFGIMAVRQGLSWWQAVLVSVANLTSAGQVAGVGIMSASGGLIEMAVSQLIINIRYSLMAISLSQKTDSSMNTGKRLISSMFITDEIFGVACSQDLVGFKYFMGLAALPVIGWTAGTLTGAVAGNILPSIVTDSLAIGIFGMFVAIVLPVCRKSKIISLICSAAVIMSCLLRYVPLLYEHVSSGFAVIISAVLASVIGVFITPEGKEEADG